MRIRLTRKLAECVDGIDLSGYRPGDVLDVPAHHAELLIAERWAVRVARSRLEVRASSRRERHRAAAADAPARRTRTVEQLRRVREQMEQRRFEMQERRRAEDRIREELQESRATIIPSKRR